MVLIIAIAITGIIKLIIKKAIIAIAIVILIADYK